MQGLNVAFLAMAKIGLLLFGLRFVVRWIAKILKGFWDVR